MANHKATIKSAKQSRVRRARNRYDKITTRNLIRNFNNETDSKKKAKELPNLFSHIDKLAKKNIIHKNKAANLKRKLTFKVKAIQKENTNQDVVDKKTISKKKQKDQIKNIETTETKQKTESQEKTE